jgi:hypothetical protein
LSQVRILPGVLLSSDEFFHARHFVLGWLPKAFFSNGLFYLATLGVDSTAAVRGAVQIEIAGQQFALFLA